MTKKLWTRLLVNGVKDLEHVRAKGAHVNSLSECDLCSVSLTLACSNTSYCVIIPYIRNADFTAQYFFSGSRTGFLRSRCRCGVFAPRFDQVFSASVTVDQWKFQLVSYCFVLVC